MRPSDEATAEHRTEAAAENTPLKPWTAPLLSFVTVDISKTEGASGSGSDGGASGFNAS